MRNSDDLFDMLFRLVLKNTFAPDKTSPQDNRAENQLQLAALGLLAFVGADALKVVFRKNFGQDGLSMVRVALSFLAFCMISTAAFILSKPETEINETFGTHQSYLFVGVFYLILAFFVLIKGIQRKKESKTHLHIHPDYKGDSYLLSGLISKNGWSQANVQNWAEPLITIALGSLLAMINLLWGIPLIFCAISIWGYQVTEYLFGHNPVNDKLQKNGYQNQHDEFSPFRH